MSTAACGQGDKGQMVGSQGVVQPIHGFQIRHDTTDRSNRLPELEVLAWWEEAASAQRPAPTPC